MNKILIANWDDLEDRKPQHKIVAGVDLVVTRFDEDHSVLYGRCLHRGALMADGHVQGDNLICGLHNWDYRLDTGVSEYNNKEKLKKFSSWIEEKSIYLDEEEIKQWAKENPQPYKRDEYLGTYQDIHGTEEEPHNHFIQELAKNGLKNFGSHGPVVAMGVERGSLPAWDSIQIVTAQLDKLPLLEEEPVKTDVTIGLTSKKPLTLDIPLFISDMSFGALSKEAKLALAMGAELAGTGICSGEGGMLPQEQEANSKYFYELASGRFGFSFEKVRMCQAFHLKGGQGAKTGIGGHLPGNKVLDEIASVRGINVGESAISPSRFPEWNSLNDYKSFIETVREETGGIPIGYKLSAQKIENDLRAALELGVDYIILDGRGGGTGAAPTIFRDHISVPTIPALARAKRFLNSQGADHVSLIITGGLRTPPDFVKALALGADAVALSNSALQAIGCLGMRACQTNNCPVGIATQKEDLRSRLIIEDSAKRLERFFSSSVELMKTLARACGHDHLNQFKPDDLVTFSREMADLAKIHYGGDSLPGEEYGK